ncbi:MAG: hypothetical protein Phyf2KO_02650 [Phycisphaerales bacterium]
MRWFVAVVVICLCMFISAAAIGASDQAALQPTTHTVFVVRHAEKVSDGSHDPDLSAKGTARAERLATMLREEPIIASYVTATKRSAQTAGPLAASMDLHSRLYEPTDYDSLARSIDAIENDGSVLVVGHSNTVSGILEGLGSAPLGELGDDEYDNLFIVVRAGGEHVRTVRLRF